MNDEQQPVGETYSRFRPVPIRYLLPNIVTLIALCSGVTGIRFAFEGRFEIAVAAVILAIGLDAIDGRLARYLQGTSRFGAELDSLADFVNFGVAPALILYFWSLNTVRPVGWVICLMLAIACALRLARFNVMLGDPNKPAYAQNFFTGIPAPAGAALALIPLYYGFLMGDAYGHKHAIFVAPLIVAIAVLMVSRVPTYSGKNMTRVPREMVVPVLALAVLVIICVITLPWQTLLALSLAYLAFIPVSVFRYWQLKRRHEQGAEATPDATT